MNYKLDIQYDGTDYSGWQIQNGAVTIQQKIVDAVELLTKGKINLIGSGRTDTGVHAFGQIANFKSDQKLNISKFHYSLNSILPKDISVLNVAEVDESFHSRFDAKSRAYFYLISTGKSPFFNKYSHELRWIHEADFAKLNGLSKLLIGKHDFSSFAKKNEEIKNKFCEISEIHWHKGKQICWFYIKADRFLHGMVRAIVGTLLFAAKNNFDENYINSILEAKNREAAHEAAPAKGLFLYKVRY
jgi:tRNA pseudouridine38-40 synthase